MKELVLTSCILIYSRCMNPLPLLQALYTFTLSKFLVLVTVCVCNKAKRDLNRGLGIKAAIL